MTGVRMHRLYKLEKRVARLEGIMWLLLGTCAFILGWALVRYAQPSDQQPFNDGAVENKSIEATVAL